MSKPQTRRPIPPVSLPPAGSGASLAKAGRPLNGSAASAAMVGMSQWHQLLDLDGS